MQVGLMDDRVFEIMLNPDGLLWFITKDEAAQCVGELCVTESGAFVHALAQMEHKYLNEKTPYLDCRLPFFGERVNVTIPPISERISFNIRKKAKNIYTLQDYVDSGIMTKQQSFVLQQAIVDRKNILVSGSPASGKTTLTNALLDHMSVVVPEGHRVLVLEQVPELQCQVKNLKTMLVSETVSMNALLFIAMRNSPDRIVIGEVRDGAALDMLKAWNTGCPGGVATIHANNAAAAMQRVLDLSSEVSNTPPYSLALEAVDVIVQIASSSSNNAKRCVTEIVSVDGFDSQSKTYQFSSLNNECRSKEIN